MDGKTLYREVERILGEPQGSGFIDSKTIYDCLYEAAIITTQRTKCFSSTQSITTVASTRGYNLNTDFLELAWMDSNNRPFIKYSDGTNTYFLYEKPYDSLILANQSTAVSIPSYFSIVDAAIGSTITGTASSGGSLSDGECTLTSTGSTFVTSGVSVGDSIRNTTDDAEGVILTVTSNTALKTAMFHGTDNDWDSSDAYIIFPQGKYTIQFDPPPSTASHTVTVYYIKRPAPVYSPQRFYNFAPDYKQALIHYAAWKYKYIDREPNFGDGFYKFWDNAVRLLASGVNNATQRKGIRVNLKKSTKGYQSYR